jgi:hypothetical protein
MKNKQLLTAAFFALVLSSCMSSEFTIQESEVPKDVLAAFKAKYPNAQNVKWEAEKEKGRFYFEAEWKENGKEIEVHISPDGTSVEEDK